MFSSWKSYFISFGKQQLLVHIFKTTQFETSLIFWKKQPAKLLGDGPNQSISILDWNLMALKYFSAILVLLSILNVNYIP